jgi:Tol biopolymer transport system component
VIGEKTAACELPTPFATLLAGGALLALLVGAANAPKQRGALYVVGPGGGKPKRIVAHCKEGFAWSPDGRSIAYARLIKDDASPDVSELVDVRSGARHRLGNNGRPEPPAWSPDSKRIAYPRGDDIVVVSRVGSADPVELNGVPGEPGTYYPAYWAAWSPDGEQVAFTTLSQQVAVVRPDGSALHFVTYENVVGLAVPVRWLPDSNHLLFVGGAPNEGGGPLMEVTVAGADLRPITPAGSNIVLFSVSRDGRRIAYTDEATNYSISVANADGTDARRIGRGLVGDNAWSPRSKIKVWLARRRRCMR